MSSLSIPAAMATGIYPERQEPRVEWLDRMAATATGMLAPWLRPRASRFGWIVDLVNHQSRSIENLTDDEIQETSQSLRQSLRSEGFKREWVAQAFALVREASQRTLGLRHFDVQLVGGLILLQGMVAEMETGEGKTLTATLPACTAALAGVPVHIITVNDYLTQRDADEMRPVYAVLGLSVGSVVNGQQPLERRDMYRRDITYCTNKELTFDYLRDRIALGREANRLKLSIERLAGGQGRASRLV